jgi:hypothetical protein
MKKVKFDNRLSIELQKKVPGIKLTPGQMEVMQLEGWLVDEHVCVQKPMPEHDANWRVSLYPWGHKIGFDFYTKADAVEYAKDVSSLGIDWNAIYAADNWTETDQYHLMLFQLRAIRAVYEAEGYFDSNSDDAS